MKEWFAAHWLLVLGFGGQILFGTRFLIQWIASEIKKESHIPIVFWYFSLGGGLLLLVSSDKNSFGLRAVQFSE